MRSNKIIITLAMCLAVMISVLAYKGEAKAAGDYYLQINKGTNVVTAFRYDGTPVKAFVCSTGTATPLGTFYTSQKLRWHVLDGPSYGQYCTRITGSILFHSVWYYENGNLASQSYREYNKLGTTASHGCVRLTVADAKWIYDNCPLSTKVNIIYGSSAYDPLGKPEAMKVDPNQRTGWDPTDPAPGNPYAALWPRIQTFSSQVNVEYGSSFNPYSGVAAYDSLGNDISSKITYTGSVNTNQLGSYVLTYTITDSLGRSSSASVTYNVVDTKKAVIKGVRSSLTREYNYVFKLRSKARASSPTGANLTNKIKIKIRYPGSKKIRTYTRSTIRLSKLGTYKIYYYVTNPNNNKITKVTCSIKVRDTKKPKLTGVRTKRTLEYNSVLNLRSGISSKLVSGKSMTSRIVIKVMTPGSKSYRRLSMSSSKKYRFSKTGSYRIYYSVTNPYNKKAITKKVMVVKVRDTKAPVLKGVGKTKTIEFGTKLNLRSGISAKLLSGKSLTSKIQVSITKPDKKTAVLTGKYYTFQTPGTYRIKYQAVNPSSKKSKTSYMSVVVRDTAAPVITGVSNKTVEFGAKLNLRTGITAKLKSGSNITSGMTITVAEPGKSPALFSGAEYVFQTDGKYVVTYSAKNPTGSKTATARMEVTVHKDVRVPQIVIDVNKVKTVDTGMAYNLLDGVSANLAGDDINGLTAEITAGKDENDQDMSAESLPVPVNNQVVFSVAGSYTISYTAVNPNNSQVSQKLELVIQVTQASAASNDIYDTPDTDQKDLTEDPSNSEKPKLTDGKLEDLDEITPDDSKPVKDETEPGSDESEAGNTVKDETEPGSDESDTGNTVKDETEPGSDESDTGNTVKDETEPGSDESEAGNTVKDETEPGSDELDTGNTVKDETEPGSNESDKEMTGNNESEISSGASNAGNTSENKTESGSNESLAGSKNE